MTWPDNLKSYPEPGATDQEIASLGSTVFAPLSDAELDDLAAEHRNIVGDGQFDPPLEPATWSLPDLPFPESYLDFLRYSNGGSFCGTYRDFDPLFTTQEIRKYMLAYSIPHWMPLSVPIAFDGGGTFFLFDMRKRTPTNDYPILYAHAGSLNYDDAYKIADSFDELLKTRLGKL